MGSYVKVYNRIYHRSEGCMSNYIDNSWGVNILKTHNNMRYIIFRETIFNTEAKNSHRIIPDLIQDNFVIVL